MKLDMSAIAKGFTSDLIAELLIKNGCKNYLVEIGGEVVAKGKNEKGKTWTIGISKPDEDLMVSTSELTGKNKITQTMHWQHRGITVIFMKKMGKNMLTPSTQKQDIRCSTVY